MTDSQLVVSSQATVWESIQPVQKYWRPRYTDASTQRPGKQENGVCTLPGNQPLTELTNKADAKADLEPENKRIPQSSVHFIHHH